MSDLDLDAIRQRCVEVQNGEWAVLGSHNLRNPLNLAEAMALLDYAEEGRDLCLRSAARIAELLAEVERLRANQLPDGGEWRTQDGHLLVGGHFCACSFPSHSKNRLQATRRVWTGPAQPLSDASTTPDPDSATQTTV